ncbi:MAG: 3-hydroxyacyl-[acyl-carrier-protein] dehydratase FabZ, partial [Burkholderiaceae bacterium]
LVMEVEILRQSRGIWKFQSKALVDGQLAVEAELMCTMRSINEPEPVTAA